ncbi:hypothetical protein O0L34_g16191 [Tuta absoluta]|nr:hypothetical protein O0L34_g16191 [Tuta absoluta]
MGLALSALISYAGIRDALECLQHISRGMLPDVEPDFRDLVDYWTMLLQKSANPSNSADWTRQTGQGYLCLTEDTEGKLKSAAVKYYDGQPDSTAVLFSTKISSFGQESVESNSSHANGDYRTDRYTPTRTKTIISSSLESFSVGQRNRSPTSENISDPRFSEGSSFERDEREDKDENNEKVTWHYRPKSPITPQPLPEIQFQSYDDDTRGVKVYSEDFLRSLDGIKHRPLQRNDPTGRRRSFKKRHSSSSTSSRESRQSREEELKMFTSLEEAEFERMSAERGSISSSPNLNTRSYSRSRSREKSNERTHSWDIAAPEDTVEVRPRLKDVPKLESFEEEEKEDAKEKVTGPEVEEEDLDSFWGSGD